MLRSTGAATLLTLLLALPAAANAGALSLAALHELNTHVECVASCPALPAPPAKPSYDEHAARLSCLAECGSAPRLWEKNGVAPVDATDLRLAVLERMDADDSTQSIICTRGEDGRVVVPGALCATPVCEQVPQCSYLECARPSEVVLECFDKPGTGNGCWWPAARGSMVTSS